MHKYIMCIDPVSNRLKEERNMRESLLTSVICNLRYPSIESGNGFRKGNSSASFCPRGEREHYILSLMSRICPKLCQLVLVIVLMAALPFGAAQSFDEPYFMKPTPILRGAGSEGYDKRHVKHETPHSSKSESTSDSISRLQNIRMLADPNELVAANSDNVLNESLDQARFNLATHVMSNGVELIIASDKIKHIDKQASSIRSSSISLPSRNVQQKPITLAPSTLKNHMLLAEPTVRQENFSIPIEENQFITKTCLTTYTYHTTYLNKGSTTVESREQVVLNRQTEERKFLRASSKLSLGVTLSNTPELAVGIFPTTTECQNMITTTYFGRQHRKPFTDIRSSVHRHHHQEPSLNCQASTINQAIMRMVTSLDHRN
ncbi:uncharacterized protein Dmoj_GI26085 [Drosophila mojavensis]|uniref:Uncharacterized protein n=1 Tax=Drosophila mojavensis TaxID=7230 RepID=A0A0Q9XG75_DROMO|nr:uncharacterized protein Dmoj_GI26085 [Drosophila mojavensis]